MSITFWIPQAPVVRVAPFADEPEYLEEVAVAPFLAINMSNCNASDLLKIVAPWADPTCGRWEGDTIHRVRKQIMILLNRNPEKYLDAPVVAWVEVVDSYEGPCHFNGEKLLDVGKHKLIVKPGEEK